MGYKTFGKYNRIKSGVEPYLRTYREKDVGRFVREPSVRLRGTYAAMHEYYQNSFSMNKQLTNEEGSAVTHTF